MKHILFLFLLVLSLGFLESCGVKKLDPGRCEVNDDCKQSLRCVDTYCKDIYYPPESLMVP
ncbi:MAG: hypothetical protein LBE20_01880 [Deltaproteobacteria bacterium]|jgi:hypothetical protein|nr:hypothetical protein [Deltaproteobacteria bacterium]